MDYWAETMQDDSYLIAADGWVRQTARILESDKKGKKGQGLDLRPDPQAAHRRPLLRGERPPSTRKQAELEATTASLAEMEEEHGGEDGFFGGFTGSPRLTMSARLKEIEGDPEAEDEAAVLKRWLALSESEAALKKQQ